MKKIKKDKNEAILQVKNNQKSLFINCKKICEKIKCDYKNITFEDKKRNRIETRKTEVYLNPLFDEVIEEDWGEYIKAIFKVTRLTKRLDTRTKKWISSFEISFYASTVVISAKDEGNNIRNHWGIENRNHNVRDGSFNEDGSRIRKNPHIFAKLRSFSLNIFRANSIENINNERNENAFDLDRFLKRYMHFF